jgi:hypothetical protein
MLTVIATLIQCSLKFNNSETESGAHINCTQQALADGTPRHFLLRAQLDVRMPENVGRLIEGNQ